MNIRSKCDRLRELRRLCGSCEVAGETVVLFFHSYEHRENKGHDINCCGWLLQQKPGSGDSVCLQICIRRSQVQTPLRTHKPPQHTHGHTLRACPNRQRERLFLQVQPAALKCHGSRFQRPRSQRPTFIRKLHCNETN